MLAQASRFVAMGRPLGRGWGPHCRRSQRHWPGAASAVARRWQTATRRRLRCFHRSCACRAPRTSRSSATAASSRRTPRSTPPPCLGLLPWDEPLERGATARARAALGDRPRALPGTPPEAFEAHALRPTDQPTGTRGDDSAESANLQRWKRRPAALPAGHAAEGERPARPAILTAIVRAPTARAVQEEEQQTNKTQTTNKHG